MNNSENIFFKVHQIDVNGIVNSIHYEEDFITHRLVSRTPITTDNAVNEPSLLHWTPDLDTKINLTYHYHESDNSSVTVIKIGGVEDLNPFNYATEISSSLNDPCDPKVLNNKPKKDSKVPNIPTMIRCQNCDTNFPTKYQYQR